MRVVVEWDAISVPESHDRLSYGSNEAEVTSINLCFASKNFSASPKDKTRGPRTHTGRAHDTREERSNTHSYDRGVYFEGHTEYTDTE